jgi:hypothetical protein
LSVKIFPLGFVFIGVATCAGIVAGFFISE